jgi:hypothetical protein
VEQCFDFIISAGWIVGTSQLAVFAKCPSYTKKVNSITSIFEYVDNSTQFCPTLVTTICLGFLCGVAFLVKFSRGFYQAKDIETHMVGKHIMFARGNWKD